MTKRGRRRNAGRGRGGPSSVAPAVAETSTTASSTAKTAKTSARASLARGGDQLPGRLDRWITPTALSLTAGLVSLGLGCYQLILSHVFTGVIGWDEGYDEGVYVGAAVRFVHGVLPYRDFVLLHPPGFLLLMAPVALLGNAFGAHVTLEVARCITAIFVAMNAVLVGLIVRPLGRVATATAAFGLALWPLTVAVERTVELEPYLVFFCLLSAYLMFDGGRFASWTRVLLGGISLGFAVEVKVWAILVVVATALVFLPKWRTRGLPLALGLAAGIVPGAPFFLAAPRAFVHDVIVTQLSRNGSMPVTSLQGRLLALTAIGRLPSIGPRVGLAVGLCCLFGLLVLAVFVFNRSRLVPLEWFALVSSVVVFVGMFESPSPSEWYWYFPVAFVAMLIGLCVSRVCETCIALTTRRRGKPYGSVGVGAVFTGVLALCLASFLVQQEGVFAEEYLQTASDPGAELASVIPAGSCVIADFTTDLLVADRFTPARPGCPAVVDPYGSFLAEDDGVAPNPSGQYVRAFGQQWFSDLRRADYLVLLAPYDDYFPWTRRSYDWFNREYRLVAHFPHRYPPGSVGAYETFDPSELYVYHNTSISIG